MNLPDEHFRAFINTLELTIDRYEGPNNTAAQKAMVERLVKLETQFRKTLIRHHWGKFAYQDFIKFIMDERRNILMARPYFRERNEMFQAEISDVLRKRNHRALYRYQCNFPFIEFVVKGRKWGKGSEIMRLYRDIRKQRDELCERNMPLAISEARVFYAKVPKSHLAYMDCIQHAADGLMSAIDKYCLPYSPNFRSVIIGRIRGNLIEAYSETSLHFYPGDKRRLYRARKIMARMEEPIDYEKVCKLLNEEEETPVTVGELVNLLAAASVINESMLVNDTIAHDNMGSPLDEATGEGLASYGDDTLRPDIVMEEAEARHRVADAINSLAIRDQKLLRLKGVEF